VSGSSLSDSVRSEGRAENYTLGVCHRLGSGIGIDLQKRRSSVDLYVRNGENAADFSRKWSDYFHFHLHSFQDCYAVSSANRIAGLHGDGNHYRRSRRMYYASVISIDAMGHTIYLDPVIQSLNCGNHMEVAPETAQPIFILAKAVDVNIRARTI
jgi:hypothetical protein